MDVSLGQHDGIINFTVGQRRGLKVATGDPLYVVKVDADQKQVIVGPKEALAKPKIYVKEVNWLDDFTESTSGREATVKIRSTHEPVKATIKKLNNDRAEVTFDAPEYGVANGQACVFYNQNRVLGGGWICG